MAEAKVTSKKNVEIEQHKSKTAELEMVIKMKDEQLKALEEKQGGRRDGSDSRQKPYGAEVYP